jgi:RecA/RadA recombinase
MKAFDVSKFRKTLTKSIEGLGVGFNDPTDWISCGNYALNYLISGDFNKGIPLGKVTVFAGESGCLPALAKVDVKYTINEVGFNETVTVSKLRELVHDSAVEKLKISTPDDYQLVGQWFDKGSLSIVKITTATRSAESATNHLYQLEDGEWVTAGELTIGDSVMTVDGAEEITSKEYLADAECYDFEVLHPNHRYWSDGFSSHNSGKSYICSGNIVKNAQEQGIFVVLIDSENALDEAWLKALGVDTDESKLMRLSMSMIDDVAKTISEFMKEIKGMNEEDRPKVLFVVDSLGMLLTPVDVNQFEGGDLKGDMGRKPKALMALVRNSVNLFGNYNVGMVCTNHTYDSQDPYNPDPRISGGSGPIFASSIVVAMKKLKLKEDEEGNKTTTVQGIRAGCKIMKTRYAKPFEDIEVHIPYTEGMSLYSGMFGLLERKGLITKEGNRYSYIDTTGVTHKYFRKEWNRNENGILDLVISEFHTKVEAVEVSAGLDDELVEEELD